MKQLKTICKKLLTGLSLLFFTCYVFAQEDFKVTGKILSIDNNEPLKDINVRVEGATGLIVNSDENGQFSFEVPTSDVTLKFTYPGYLDYSVYLNGQSEITVKLIPEEYPISLLDNVVTPAGVKQKRFIAQSYKDLDNSDFTFRPYFTAEKYLAGKVSGVNVTSFNGAPGAGSFVTIRGLNSVYAGNQPLYIIDGMETSDIPSGELSSGALNSELLNLNPDDIESVTILKDAAAKALYGSRAANGVVLIETFKGEKGSSKIDFSVNMGWDKISNPYTLLGAEENRDLLKDMVNSQMEEGIYSETSYMDALINDTSSINYQRYNNSTNWFDLINQQGYYGNYYFRIRGGDDVSKYSFSVGYKDQTGVIVNTGLQKLTARFNLDYNVSNKFRIGNTIAFARIDQDLQRQVDSRYNPIMLSFKKSPFLSANVQNSEGVVQPSYSDYDIFGMTNPVALVNNILNEYLGTSINGSLFAQYKISTGMYLYAVVGLDHFVHQEKAFIPSRGVAPYLDMERISEQTYKVNSLIDSRIEAVYNKKINYVHNVSAIVGGELINNVYKGRLGRSYNSPGDDFVALKQGTYYDTSSSSVSNYWILSSYGNIDYSLKETYLVNLTVRADGSSRYGISNPVIILPAVGLGWRMSNEAFLRSKSWIDEFKLRVSFGYTGNNNIGDYTSRLLYLPGNYKNLGGYSFGQMGNEKLKPEITREIDAGFDLSMLNQQLNITIDVYDRTNTNMLVYNNIPLETGFDNAFINNGKVNNKGIEFGFEVYSKVKDINWNIGANLCYNKNEVIELPEKTPMIIAGYNGYMATAVEGQPLGVYYGYQTDGVFESDTAALGLVNGDGYTYKPFSAGDVKFVDLSGPDGTPDGVINEYDKTYLGKSMPDFFGGFNGAIEFKGIEFSFLCDMQLGREVINATRAELESLDDYINQSTTVNDRWIQEGDITDIPKLTYGDPAGNNRFSDRWVEDGSFVRLREVKLAYSFPDYQVRRFYLQKLKIFVSVENLMTISSYSGFDPEFNHLGDGILTGVDMSSTPLTRFFNAGISIGL